MHGFDKVVLIKAALTANSCIQLETQALSARSALDVQAWQGLRCFRDAAFEMRPVRGFMTQLLGARFSLRGLDETRMTRPLC